MLPAQTNEIKKFMTSAPNPKILVSEPQIASKAQ